MLFCPYLLYLTQDLELCILLEAIQDCCLANIPHPYVDPFNQLLQIKFNSTQRIGRLFLTSFGLSSIKKDYYVFGPALDYYNKQYIASYMDIFQFIADFLHLIAVLILLLKILASKNVIGLSYRTQQIFLVVCLSRYIDLFLGWKTLYAFLMKIIFISLTGYTIYLMKFKRPYSLSLDRQADIFPHYYLYGAALLAAIIAHKSLNPVDFLWSFSVWLQSLAILPQLYLINKVRDIENITAHYVLFLGLYRGFYILHWIFQWEHVFWPSFIAGVVQTLLYADFMYYFVKANQNDRFMVFPV